MRAIVDPDLCSGCGLCVDTCPEVFEMEEEEEVARVLVDKVPEDAEECVQQAAEECPCEAIEVVGD